MATIGVMDEDAQAADMLTNQHFIHRTSIKEEYGQKTYLKVVDLAKSLVDLKKRQGDIKAGVIDMLSDDDGKDPEGLKGSDASSSIASSSHGSCKVDEGNEVSSEYVSHFLINISISNIMHSTSVIIIGPRE